MKKTRKSVIALFLTFALMAGCMLTLFGLPTGARNALPDRPEDIDSFYYLSDDPQSSTRYQNLLSVIPAGHYYYFGDSNNNNATVRVANYMGIEGTCAYQNISDAYVIFELKSEFPIEITDGTVTLPEMLETIFNTMRGNNCKIMFISNTDEALYAMNEQNAFLDYVYIHVNTDTWYTFFSNVFYRIYRENQNDLRWGDATLLFSANLRDNTPFPTALSKDNEFYKNCPLFKKYIIPYLRTVWEDEAVNGILYNKTAIQNRHVEFIFHDDDNSFFEITQRTPLYIDSFGAVDTELLPHLQGNHVYAIGRVDNVAYFSQWLTLMIDIRNSYDLDFPIFVYNPGGYTVEGLDEDNVYVTGGALDVYPLMEAFLQGNDMLTYQNWSGRAYLTYKALPTGEGGWMLDVHSPARIPPLTYVKGYQLYMTEEEYDYIYNYQDDEY